MSIRTMISAAAFGVALTAGIASASADDEFDTSKYPPGHPPSCVLRDYRVTSVAPYEKTEWVSRSTIRRLRGAELFVVAEPGLTAEWLQLKLNDHLKKAGDMKTECSLNVKNVRVDVDSAGSGFRVKLIPKDTSKSKKVLHRAIELFGARG